MRCAVTGMFKFLYLVSGASQSSDDAIASLHLAMACFNSGGHVCLDVDPNSCIWALPMFSNLVSSAAVHLVQVRYMAQSIVSAAWSLSTSLESLECLSRMSAGGSPTLHSLTGGSLFPPDLSDKLVHCGHFRSSFHCIGVQVHLAGCPTATACQRQTSISSRPGGWGWCFQLS